MDSGLRLKTSVSALLLFYWYNSFEDQCKSWSLWLHETEERISTEALGESKQHIPDKKNEVQKVEAFLEELLVTRYKTKFVTYISSFWRQLGMMF